MIFAAVVPAWMKDQHSQDIAWQFVSQLKNIYPEAIVLPVLNGRPAKELTGFQLKYKKAGIRALVSLKKGVGPAQIVGYKFCATRFPNLPVVKLDTEEHDQSAIPQLLEIAVEQESHVVGNLIFNNDQLIDGSPDWIAHHRIWPEMWRSYSNRKLQDGLSAAYGFHSFGPGVLSAILPRAQAILALAEHHWRMADSTGNRNPVAWGVDAALIAASLNHPIPLQVVEVQAIALRNRPIEKINEQYNCEMAVLTAARSQSISDASLIRYGN